jgi:hypothetical protein
LEAGATAAGAAAEVARAVAAEFASMVTGAAAMSARPSGRSRRNLCRVHSGIRKRDCMDNGGPQNHRCLHIFRCSRERYHRRFGTCSRTRTILLQETAAAVSEEESEAVEAAKCTVDHSRCNRCQEDIGSSSCTRSLALRLHRCQHRMNCRGCNSNNSLNSRMNCMCPGTQLQVVKAVADWEVDEVGAADRRGAVRSRCNRFRAGTASTLQFPDLRRCTHRRLTKSRRCQSRGRHHPQSAGRGVAEGKWVVSVAGVGLVEAGAC